MSGSRPSAQYEIRIEGIPGERWTGWFEGLKVSSEAGENDHLRTGDRPASAARVLVKVRDLACA